MLFLGGDFLVRAAQDLADALKKRVFFISLLLLGMGSSAPEFFVTLRSHLEGQPALALGNILGSNIFNILIVSSLIIFSSDKIPHRSMILKSKGLLLVTTLIAGFLAWDLSLSRTEGFFLLILFSLFLIHPPEKNTADPPPAVKKQALWIIASLITAGFVLLFLGSKITIDSSIKIGEGWGFSKRIIGLFFLSIGTSLPELAIGLTALVKKNSSAAFGSIIGSNAFNTLLIVGTASALSDLPLSPALLKTDGAVMYMASLALFFCLLGFNKIPKWMAGIFLISYGLYAFFILFPHI